MFVQEFDHPYNLLQKKDGIFYNMVQQTGAHTASTLFEIAKTVIITNFYYIGVHILTEIVINCLLFFQNYVQKNMNGTIQQ